MSGTRNSSRIMLERDYCSNDKATPLNGSLKLSGRISNEAVA
jgi:hypothetical protein